jgi:hypothetical protein
MRAVVLLVSLAVIGCGGGDSNAPNPAFPDAAGVYSVSGDFDGLTPAEASFVGTVTLTQASREGGTLGGSASITATVGSDAATASDDALDQASVSQTGALAFTLVDQSGTWTFTGTLSGNSITGGRHTLNVPGSGTISGNWTGTRTAASALVMSPRGTATDLRALARALQSAGRAVRRTVGQETLEVISFGPFAALRVTQLLLTARPPVRLTTRPPLPQRLHYRLLGRPPSGEEAADHSHDHREADPCEQQRRSYPEAECDLAEAGPVCGAGDNSVDG